MTMQSLIVSNNGQPGFKDMSPWTISKPFKLSSIVTQPHILTARYGESGHFRLHYDWLPENVPSLRHSGNRVSSFFVYLSADCEGGTTVFPGIMRQKHETLCEFLRCHDQNGTEVKWIEVKPKVGTALFWYNIGPTGDVDMKTLHAGSVVTNGTKIGLNIWTRERSWRDLIHGNV